MFIVINKSLNFSLNDPEWRMYFFNWGYVYYYGEGFRLTIENDTPEVVMQMKRNEFLKNLEKQACL